jgi:hypothetical protein
VCVGVYVHTHIIPPSQVEAVVLPITHSERFKAIGITPPKGVLLYGPPGYVGLGVGVQCMHSVVQCSM